MYSLVRWAAVFVVTCAFRFGIAQEPARIAPADNSGVAVRLEAHDGQTDFNLGDRITLDLLFTAKSPGYAVFEDTNPFNAPQDLVNVTPMNGWFRSQGNQPGGSPKDFGRETIRIPVVLNRSIVFQQPGHYDVTVTTRRLIPSRTSVELPAPATACCHRVEWSETTNAVGINIRARNEQEESALVAQLSKLLEKKPGNSLSDEWKKKNEPLTNELESMLKNPPADPQVMMELVAKLTAAENAEFALFGKQKEVRHDTAVRLSLLQGDDAIRAKVHWILETKEDGSDDTGLVMLSGLPQSSNMPLQVQILQAAWDDPLRVPTGELHSALQQSKAFLQHQTFELYYSHGVPGKTQPHAQAVQEFQRELGEIVASLPQRTGLNLRQTLNFLLSEGGGPSPQYASRICPQIARSSAEMSPSMQDDLLSQRWKELYDPVPPLPSEPLKGFCASTR